MAYISKNPDGVIFLWNNKPFYNYYGSTYMAWLPNHIGQTNEIPIDVTSNDDFRNLFVNKLPPCCMEINILCKEID